jgi:hypothetical protein
VAADSLKLTGPSRLEYRGKRGLRFWLASLFFTLWTLLVTADDEVFIDMTRANIDARKG